VSFGSSIDEKGRLTHLVLGLSVRDFVDAEELYEVTRR
jgi:hypothetical protein